MFLKGKVYLVSSGNRTTVPLFVAFSLIIYLPRSCRTKKKTRVDFFWHVTFTDVKIFISFPRLTSVYREVHVHIYRHTYTDTYLTAYRLYMDYRCYQMILQVKRFYTNRERCDVLTGYLSLGRRLGGYLANVWYWAKHFTKFYSNRN